jgi:hypothetical protein
MCRAVHKWLTAHGHKVKRVAEEQRLAAEAVAGEARAEVSEHRREVAAAREEASQRVLEVTQQLEEQLAAHIAEAAVRARRGRLSDLSVFHNKSTRNGVFVWTCGVLGGPKRRLLAGAACIRAAADRAGAAAAGRNAPPFALSAAAPMRLEISGPPSHKRLEFPIQAPETGSNAS